MDLYYLTHRDGSFCYSVGLGANDALDRSGLGRSWQARRVDPARVLDQPIFIGHHSGVTAVVYVACNEQDLDHEAIAAAKDEWALEDLIRSHGIHDGHVFAYALFDGHEWRTTIPDSAWRKQATRRAFSRHELLPYLAEHFGNDCDVGLDADSPCFI